VLSTVTAEPEPQARRPGGDRREHDLGRGYGEIRPVVLADGEEVDAGLVGGHALLDHLPQRLRRADRPSAGIDRDVPERVQSQLDWMYESPVSDGGPAPGGARGGGGRRASGGRGTCGTRTGTA
jgi:hypothetical protein